MTLLKSWIPVAENADFSIHNLPYGIFSVGRQRPRLGVAIGDQILDLAALAQLGHFDKLQIDKKVFRQSSLNAFIALGKEKTTKIRAKIQQLLTAARSPLKKQSKAFVDQSKAQLHLPIEVGDYTDFYSSIEHATNVGKMFRDPKNALLPNWRHIPVGYHGRASSIIVSGQAIHRPKGQLMPKDAKKPIYGPSGRVDFELEMAFVVGKGNPLGTSVSTADAEDHIFGLALFNDWSARDIQKWEYVPLGPFLGKSFASSISPWIVPLEALDPFRVKGPNQRPKVLPYLQYEGLKNYDVHLEVGIQPDGGEETIVSRSNYKYMYWNMAQQLAHHTVNGCNLRVGDVMASGTISGKKKNSYGSMLELAWAGTRPVKLSDGSTRVFIKDQDTVRMRGYAEKEGIRVGFGEVQTQLLPAT
ncbi:MAG: fumarylacetoacetase [Bacteroidota bacterium]